MGRFAGNVVGYVRLLVMRFGESRLVVTREVVSDQRSPHMDRFVVAVC